MSIRTRVAAAVFLLTAAATMPLMGGIGGSAAASASTSCTLTATPVGGGASGTPPVVPLSPVGQQTMITLSADQLRNATTIVNVAGSLRLPPRAAVIAVATALQESSLTNLTTAVDHDSLGLFQQRPSAGWGTPAQITDPVYAATQFYQHLERVQGWETLPLTQAAQDVQGSAFPDAYAKWEKLAGATVVTILGGGASLPTGCADGGGGMPITNPISLPAGFTLPPDTPATIRQAVAYALAQLGKPYIWGGVGPDGYDCSGLTMMAYKAAGITIPRGATDQSRAGIPVTAAAIKPGDLVFTTGTDATPATPVGHVGIYIGNGIMMQAPYPGKPLFLDPLIDWTLATDPFNSIVAIRRYVAW